MNNQAFVYILASQKNGTLYTGVTSNLVKRLYEHKTKKDIESFTAKYAVNTLVWYITGNDIGAAIELEKKIKNRNRAWKIALIETHNPDWKDLSLDFMDCVTKGQNDNGDMLTILSPCTQSQGLGLAGMDSATSVRNDEAVV